MTLDYRVEVKVRNNLILKQIEMAGYKTVGEFCRKRGFNNQTIGKLVNLQMSPFNETVIDGKSDIRKCVLRLMDELQCGFEDLFSESQFGKLESNKVVREVRFDQIESIANTAHQTYLTSDEHIEREERDNQIESAIEEILTPRELAVIKDRFGMNDSGECLTLEEMGEKLDVCGNRIRQIEVKALRKLRNPKHREKFDLWVNIRGDENDHI